MGKNTSIEWAHHTVNFWWGCTFARLQDGSIRQECVNCYALLLSKLFSRGKATWGPEGNRWVRHEAARRELYKLDKGAHERGVRERVFINSMSDTFEDRRDLDEAREMLWGACQFVSNIDMLLLTKRPENVMRMVPPGWLTNWPAHVWVGSTAGTQAAFDEAVPALVNIPAKVRFLSMEPLLEGVNTRLWFGSERFGHPIHWVIVGGESGPKARPMHPDWARSLRDQCKAAGVPFFFKQWGNWTRTEPGPVFGERADALHAMTIDGSLRPCAERTVRPGEIAMVKRNTPKGRLLDGVEHNAVPNA